MTEQMFYDARDLFHTVEPDTVDGAERTLRHVGLWRTRFDLRADAAISPLKTELYLPNARVRMTMKANATVLSA
jgi:hypothetical protein